MSIPELTAKMASDPRWEGFQGFHVNRDQSLLLIHRHGGAYYESVDAYLTDRDNHLKELRAKAALAQRLQEAEANAS